MTKYDPRKNAEGYNDPTPYAAEKHMMAQIRGKQARVAGGYFENIISASCDYYLSRGLAKIEKTPEPMKPLGAKNRKGQFLACYTKQAQPLMTYLEDGHCSLSNNLSENAIRPFTVGRKNWLFSASPKGAASSAIVYTMVEMAKANDLNTYKYLTYLLSQRPDAKMSDEQLEQLAPWSETAKANCQN